jgi:hypothetical protein
MMRALLGCLVVTCATGCTSTIGMPPAASAPPLGADQVASTVTADVHAPLGDVFDYVVREDTPQRDLRSYGPIAGVRSDVRFTEGGWDHPGARRVILFDDGSTVHESIEALDRSGHFRYRVFDFSSAFGTFIGEGRGYWDFAPVGDHTRVTWTYVLTAKSCEARPFVRAAVDVFFHPYMERGMESIRKHIEHGS